MMIAISPKATLYERDFNLWLEDTVRQSPSLKRHFSESFDEVFDDALKIVRIEYDVEFPDTWQFN